MAATTAQKPQRQEPLQDESEADSEFYSDDDDYYSDEDDDFSDVDDEVPRNQPQRQPQRQPQGQQQRPQAQQTAQEQPQQEENPYAKGGSMAMQPFEHIGPAETSMEGPVTYARAQRGEIPLRPGNPNQALQTGQKNETSIDDQDGLKLKLELNLDIEVELKATIRGDLTLALLA